MPASKSSGPDPETIADYIRQTYPETVVLEMTGTWFFSLDEKHWPNFATIVTTDEHDRARPDRADENASLVKAVYEQLGRARPEGLHYATFRLSDGVSFMHVVFETDQPGSILGEIAAFKAFTADIEARTEEPPAVTELTLIGSYGMGT